jgi:hypothetical protein
MPSTAPAPVAEFLRGPEAARFLGVSFAHFRKLHAPSVKLGRSRIYSVESLRAFFSFTRLDAMKLDKSSVTAFATAC